MISYGRRARTPAGRSPVCSAVAAQLASILRLSAVGVPAAAVYRGNSLRVMAEAVRWGKRGARVNTISPGIIITPLARDELTGPRGEGYRRMLELSPAGRAGTPDEVGTVGAFLMSPDGAFMELAPR